MKLRMSMKSRNGCNKTHLHLQWQEQSKASRKVVEVNTSFFFLLANIHPPNLLQIISSSLTWRRKGCWRCGLHLGYTTKTNFNKTFLNVETRVELGWKWQTGNTTTAEARLAVNWRLSGRLHCYMNGGHGGQEAGFLTRAVEEPTPRDWWGLFSLIPHWKFQSLKCNTFLI